MRLRNSSGGASYSRSCSSRLASNSGYLLGLALAQHFLGMSSLFVLGAIPHNVATDRQATDGVTNALAPLLDQHPRFNVVIEIGGQPKRPAFIIGEVVVSDTRDRHNPFGWFIDMKAALLFQKSQMTPWWPPAMSRMPLYTPSPLAYGRSRADPVSHQHH
jgi:hypothetical protein